MGGFLFTLQFGMVNFFNDRNDDLIPKYMKEMDVNLPDTYFTQMQRQRATTGDNFVINKYPNGKTKTELFLFPDGSRYKKECSEISNMITKIKKMGTSSPVVRTPHFLQGTWVRFPRGN